MKHTGRRINRGHSSNRGGRAGGGVTGGRIAIDLHGMTVWQAELALVELFAHMKPHVREVEVVHGIGGGALASFVREWYNPQIADRVHPMHNRGMTIYYLK